MLHLGIPDRSEWPEGVLEAVAAFRQGDLVANLPLVAFTNLDRPIHDRAQNVAAKDGGQRWVQLDPAPYGLVVTQTCDLALEGHQRPTTAWVQCCPVYDGLAPDPGGDGKAKVIPGNIRRFIQEGKMPSYLHVPDLPPRDEDGTSFWYADLSLEVPVERGWLASQPRAVGFQDESAREEVGRRLAWLRSRPALDGRFVRAVQGPTIDALRALMKDNAALFERLDEQVDEIGLLSDSRLDVGQAQLVILHKPDLGEDVRAWWEDLWPDLKSAADNEAFNLLPLEFADVGVYPTVRYRKLTRLPLSTMSPEPAWYGVDVDL